MPPPPKQMDLEFNNSGEGAHALAEALQTNKTLTRLDLTANQVRTEQNQFSSKTNRRKFFLYAVHDEEGGGATSFDQYK